MSRSSQAGHSFQSEVPILLNPNFLHDDAQYKASEGVWREIWNELCSSTDWSTPWLRTAFANGQPLRDGNPIFSALSRPAGRAVKVVQAEAGADSGPLSAWVKEMEDEDGTEINCLT